MKRILLSFCLLSLAFPAAWAQRSYNVRLAGWQEAARWQAALRGADSLPLGPLGTARVQPLGRNLRDEAGFWFTLSFASPADRLAGLQADARFAQVEPNRSRVLHTADPRAAEQYYHPLIRTRQAWGQNRGGGIVVGVVDTGLEYDHPEFERQLWVNPAEDLNHNGRLDATDLNDLDEDGNGRIDDVIGFDFVDQTELYSAGDGRREDGDPVDDNQHGTLVSGILAARADNGIGGYGVAPDARIMVLRAFSAEGVGEDDDIARAILYAADQGAQVLNFSFGDIYPSQMMHAAIRYASARGVVMVASAGNGTGDNLHYPSGFPEVISVSASAYDARSRSEFLWPLSSFGTSVDLCAPGSGILAPDLSDPETGELRFDFFSGTSTSAPMVSAAAAMLLARQPGLSPQQVRGVLVSTADDLLDPGWDHFTGAGRLNLERALQLPNGSQVQILNPANDAGTKANQLPIVATLLHPQFSGWTLSWQPGIQGEANWTPLAQGSAQQWADTLAVWNIASLADGDYTLRVRVQLANGQAVEDRVRVVVDRSPPTLELRVVAPIWENASRKQYWAWRASDPARVRLYYRALPAGAWQYTESDRLLRNSELLLELAPGSYAWYLRATNAAGDSVRTVLDTLDYTPQYLNRVGFRPLAQRLPAGVPLEAPTDFDQDGRLEWAMSRLDENLTVGRFLFYEWDGGSLVLQDSLADRTRFIPKGVADTDGDGSPELLGNLTDSVFLYTPPTPAAYPTRLQYFRQQGRFPAGLADTDADGNPELIQKTQRDYEVWERQGTDWVLAATLPDASGDFFLSAAPSAPVADLDGDGQPEIVFGDAEGDFHIYEHSGGGQYALRYLDTTRLTNTAPFIELGDFDGDGKPELFVAAHTSTLRDEQDFENLPLYWWVRIFKATENNRYQLVWQDHLYNLASTSWNTSYAANLDQDPAAELLLSIFPRTYLLDHDGSRYYWRWYLEGSLSTAHGAGDYNGNGIPEFSIAFGDSLRFYEQDASYTPSSSGLALQAEVLGPSQVRLGWNALPGVASYRLYRGQVAQAELPESLPLLLTLAGTEVAALDASGPSLRSWVYVLEAYDAAGNLLAVSNLAEVRTHPRPRLLAAEALDATTVALTFSQQMAARRTDLGYYRIDGTTPGQAIAASGTRVVLQLDRPLASGTHTVEVDTLLFDAAGARLDPAARQLSFIYLPDTSQLLYIRTAQRLDEKTARIRWSAPLAPGSLAGAQYLLSPTGSVVEVRQEAADQLWLRVDQVVLGTAGYPVTLRFSGLQGSQGQQLVPQQGDAATFYEPAQSLAGVYVYPNPVRPNDFVQGCRFAQLPARCTVTVYSALGQPIRRLQETDGDGGLQWDLRDASGRTVQPGVYLYRVEDANGGEVEGQFAILAP